MVFSSLLFVFLFLTLNLVCYYSVKTIRQKNIVLLVFSLIFYAWGGAAYLLLLAGMAFWSWLCALMIEKNEEQKTRKLWMWAECLVLLGLLIFFKYMNFLTGNLSALIGFPKEATKIILPIGISFYTFQLLSYVVDVYRKEVAAQPAYWKLLLYCSLFHQCIAGPIVRYQTVASEIDDRKVTLTDLTNGIRRFSIGLAKKAILANGCASVADTLLANTQSATTAAGTNEERQGVSSQQQGFTAQDMQYQQMAGSAAPVKKNKNLWLLAIPAALLVILLVIFGIKAVLSPAYLKPVKYMEKAFNKQDIDLMKKAVPDEYAEWMTDDIVDYMFDLDSDYKITIKVTDKEKIAKKDLEETLIDDYYVLDSIAEDAKAGYILEAEATLKQDGEKDTQDITLVVVKVDGKWVIVSGL